jgi:hypothetical protein
MRYTPLRMVRHVIQILTSVGVAGIKIPLTIIRECYPAYSGSYLKCLCEYNIRAPRILNSY